MVILYLFHLLLATDLFGFGDEGVDGGERGGVRERGTDIKVWEGFGVGLWWGEIRGNPLDGASG
jgi:hypothetical protein